MKFLLARLMSRRSVFAAVLFSSFVISVLALASPLFVIQVLNRYVAHGVDATLITLATGAIFAVIMEFGFRQVRLNFASSIAIRPDEELAVQNHQLIAAIKQNTLQQVPMNAQREFLNSTDALERLASAPNVATLMDLPFAALFIAALAMLSPLLAGIAIIFMVITALSGWLGSRTVEQVNAEVMKEKIIGSQHTGSLLGASDEVRAFRARGLMVNHSQTHIRRIQDLSRKVSLHRGLMQSITHGSTGMMSICIIAVGAILVVQGTLDVGIMIGANILASRALNVVNRFSSLTEPFAKAKQSLFLLKQFREMPREAAKGAAMEVYKGWVAFQDVSYSHPGNPNPLFESLTFSVPPGTVILLNGANGMGKTTLCRMIAGLIDPQRGRILVDGVDTQQLAPNWWRSQIAYLPQETRFLNGTVRENLTTMNPELEDNDLMKIINEAGLRKFVAENASGIDQKIEDNGRTLSAGIRRRLSLARALCGECNLIVMDEPTEALDADGRKTVHQVFNRFRGEGKTIFVASNDPQIIKAADIVVDLNSKPVPALKKAKELNRGAASPKETKKPTADEKRPAITGDEALIRRAPSSGNAPS